MAKRISFYLLFLTATNIACVSTHSISVEVLSPSVIEYEKPISTISAVNNTIEKPHPLDNDTVKFIKLAVEHWCNNFEKEIKRAEISNSFTLYKKNDNIDSSGFIVNINEFKIKFDVNDEDLYYQSASFSEYTEIQFIFKYYIDYAIYNCKNKKTVFKKIQADQKIWSEKHRRTDSTKFKYPDETEIILLSIGKLGKEASYDFFSEWKLVERKYFSSRKSDLVLAEYYASVQEWKKAAEIWSEHAQSHKKEAKYFTYNMAFASEMEGNLETAIYWAKKSSEELYNRRASKYLTQLEKRLKEQEKLIQQLGPPR